MPSAEAPSGPDLDLVDHLRDGDEAAFTSLVEAHSLALLAMARRYVPTAALAEEVVQETWLGVLRGLDRFEGRSSLKTWIFRILINTAKTRGRQERRSIPFSAAVGALAEDREPLLDPDRFPGADHHYGGHWHLGPTEWGLPDEELLAGERRVAVLRAIEGLPTAQRVVLTLRDIQGWVSTEVCDELSVSSVNQRVLLHRARTKVRNAVEAELGAVPPTP